MDGKSILERLSAARAILGPPKPIVSAEEMAAANAELRKARRALKRIEAAIIRANQTSRRGVSE
jgi:hypothetical protein